MADASLLVVAEHRAQAKDLNAALDLLNAQGEKNLGCVYNNAHVEFLRPMASYGYQYAYHYGRYGGHYDRIETRLSDGLAAVKPKEVEEMIVAGMGGGLVIHILEEGKQIVSTLKGCILQPQSEIQKVREYLVEHGFWFEAEDMVEEDGKYYPMMRVVPPEYCEHKTADRQEDCKKEEWEYLYGPLLLKNKNPILYEYLKHEIRIREDILLGLAGKDGERIKERMTEIEHELEVAKKAMSYYEE